MSDSEFQRWSLEVTRKTPGQFTREENEDWFRNISVNGAHSSLFTNEEFHTGNRVRNRQSGGIKKDPNLPENEKDLDSKDDRSVIEGGKNEIKSDIHNVWIKAPPRNVSTMAMKKWYITNVKMKARAEGQKILPMTGIQRSFYEAKTTYIDSVFDGKQGDINSEIDEQVWSGLQMASLLTFSMASIINAVERTIEEMEILNEKHGHNSDHPISILDVGCGCGVFGWLLRQRLIHLGRQDEFHYRLDGFDHSEIAVYDMGEEHGFHEHYHRLQIADITLPHFLFPSQFESASNQNEHDRQQSSDPIIMDDDYWNNMESNPNVKKVNNENESTVIGVRNTINEDDDDKVEPNECDRYDIVVSVCVLFQSGINGEPGPKALKDCFKICRHSMILCNNSVSSAHPVYQFYDRVSDRFFRESGHFFDIPVENGHLYRKLDKHTHDLFEVYRFSRIQLPGYRTFFDYIVDEEFVHTRVYRRRNLKPLL